MKLREIIKLKFIKNKISKKQFKKNNILDNILQFNLFQEFALVITKEKLLKESTLL